MEQDLQRFSICCQDHQFSSTSIQCFRRLVRTFLQLLIVRCLLPWKSQPLERIGGGYWKTCDCMTFVGRKMVESQEKFMKRCKLIPCVGTWTWFGLEGLDLIFLRLGNNTLLSGVGFSQLSSSSAMKTASCISSTDEPKQVAKGRPWSKFHLPMIFVATTL